MIATYIFIATIIIRALFRIYLGLINHARYVECDAYDVAIGFLDLILLYAVFA